MKSNREKVGLNLNSATWTDFRAWCEAQTPPAKYSLAVDVALTQFMQSHGWTVPTKEGEG